MLSGHFEANGREVYIVSFSLVEKQDLVKSHNDPLVITTLLSSFRTKRMIVDIDSSVDVLFSDAFQRIGIDKDRLRIV